MNDKDQEIKNDVPATDTDNKVENLEGETNPFKKAYKKIKDLVGAKFHRKPKDKHFISAKESRAIAKENFRITKEYEQRKKRKNVDESEYLDEMKDPKNIVEFEDLHTYFFTDAGVVKAVNGVTFSIPEGTTVGVVGESGCGKSVTSLSLMQLVQAPSGQVIEGSKIRFRSNAYKEDAHGNKIPIYVYEKDENGNIKHDENGRPIIATRPKLTKDDIKIKATLSKTVSAKIPLTDENGVPQFEEGKNGKKIPIYVYEKDEKGNTRLDDKGQPIVAKGLKLTKQGMKIKATLENIPSERIQLCDENGVPQFEEDANGVKIPVYVYEKDEKGNNKLDENGEPIFLTKPVFSKDCLKIMTAIEKTGMDKIQLVDANGFLQFEKDESGKQVPVYVYEKDEKGNVKLDKDGEPIIATWPTLSKYGLKLESEMENVQLTDINGIPQFEMEEKTYNVAKMPTDVMRKIRGREITMIFQEPMTSLNPIFTIGDQLDEAVLLHSEGATKESAKARTYEILNLVGIIPENVYKRYPHELSGGMRQRVMIAMALVCNPRLIIADEPTTALDVTIQAQILDLLRDIKDKINGSIMLITHDLGVIAEMADFVVVMYAGRIIEMGTAKEIFDNPMHPYTMGLQKSKPVVNKKVDRLYSIPGSVPNPINMPNYCYFKDRCSKRTGACDGEYPCMVQVTPTHQVACHLYDKEGKK